MPQVLKQKLLNAINQNDMEKVSDKLYAKEYPLSKLSKKKLMEDLVEPLVKRKVVTFDKEKIAEFMKKRRYFICLNPLVKAANRKKREYFTKIIKNKIKYTPSKEWIVKNGYKKYLKFEKEIEPTLDEKRLAAEELYDGKWIIMTNDQQISSFLAGHYYKSLQFVERGFEDLKWYICRELDKESRERGRRFIEEMNNLKAIAVDGSIPLYVRTAISPEVQQGMKKLKMKIPGKIIIDGRFKAKKISHKPGRPRKVDPKKYQLPLIQKGII